MQLEEPMKLWMSYSDRLRRRHSRGGPHIPVSRHAPVADFAAITPRFPVFRVVPDEGGKP